ncbi:MAG: hypothetical protein RLO21_15685, partial [Nitratireductor sp.]
MSVAEVKETQERPAMMDTETVSSAQLLDLREKYAGLVGGPLLEALIEKEFPGEIAVVSSFG